VGLALLLGLLTAAANVFGSYLGILSPRTNLPSMSLLIGVSGGFILAVAVLEILPEALEGGAIIPPFIVGGYLLMYVIEQYFAAHAHEPVPLARAPEPSLASSAGENGGDAGSTGDHGDHTDEHALHTEFRHRPIPITRAAAIAAFAGFMAHDFLDGLAIGAGLLSEKSVGLLVFAAVMLHEIPAGLSVATLMRAAGNSRRASFLAGVAIGIITIPGILIPFLVGDIDDRITHIFLGLAGGTFLYLSTTVLIPAAGAEHRRSVVVSVVAGAAIFWGTSLLIREVVG
jgi:zinc transporter ZupT